MKINPSLHYFFILPFRCCPFVLLTLVGTGEMIWLDRECASINNPVLFQSFCFNRGAHSMLGNAVTTLNDMLYKSMFENNDTETF